MSFELVENFLPSPDLKRGQPHNLTVDPAGKYFVYPQGRTIVVREIENPSKGYTFTGHAVEATAACFAPSGFYVASADVNGKVLIWDTTQDDHAVKYEYRPLSGKITDIRWSPDSKRIVVSGMSGEKFCHAFLWDSGSSVGNMFGQAKICNAIDFKTTRPFRVATGSDDYSVGFFHGPPFKLDHQSKNHSNFVNSVRFSPSGEFLASASADGKVFLYDGKTGETVCEVKDGEKAHSRGVYGLSWSADSTKFVTCSADASVKMWDAASKELVSTFQFEDSTDNHQLSVVWSGDNIISFSLNGNVNFLNQEDPSTPLRVVTGHHKAITAISAVVDGGVAYSASYDGKVCKFDLSNGVASDVGAFSNSVVSLASSQDGVVAACVDDTYASIEGDANSFGDSSSVDSTPNCVATGAGVTVIACVKRVELVGGEGVDVDFEAKSCSVSPDGKEVAVGGDDSKVHIYTVSGGALSEKTVVDATGPVFSVAYSPDGQYLASGDGNRNVFVFSTEDYSLKKDTWKYHTSRINALSWHPSSRYLASASLDTNVIIWHMDKPMKRITIKQAHPGHSVTAVSWISASSILTGGQDGVLRVFNITPYA